MSLFRKIAQLCSLPVLFTGCYTLQLGQKTTLSGSYAAEIAWSQEDAYKEPPKVDPADFQPAGGSMAVDLHRPWPLGMRMDITLRHWLSDTFFLGLGSDPLSLYLNTGSGPGFYRQSIRYSNIDWWDSVLAEDVSITRTPSLGFVFGSANDLNKAEKFAVQYSGSVRWYELSVNTYAGVNCVGCANSSKPKNSTRISSGLAWRHSLEIGSDEYRLMIWFEFDGTAQITGGAGLVISDHFFKTE